MSYHIFSKLTHWISAVIILGLIFVGLYMTSLDFSDFKLDLYLWHKSFGLLILILLALRIVFLLFFKKPKSLSTHKKWEKGLSHLVHVLLYGALLLMPLSGWVMSSAGDYTVQFFGVHLPDIVQKDEALFEKSKEFHEILSFVLIAAILLHGVGALKHHFIDQDRTLKRMTNESLGFFGGALLALVIGIWSVLICGYILSGFTKQISAVDVPDVVNAVLTPQAAIQADVREWVIEPKQSSIKIESAQYGQSYEGEFKTFDGQIFFDPDALDRSKVRIEVDVDSLKTGSSDRDEQALSSAWFDASVYPKAVFEADVFEHLDNEQYIAKGSLRVKEVLLPFELPFTLKIGEGQAIMHAHFELNRLDYNVGVEQSEAANSNKVSFTVVVVARSQ